MRCLHEPEDPALRHGWLGDRGSGGCQTARDGGGSDTLSAGQATMLWIWLDSDGESVDGKSNFELHGRSANSLTLGVRVKWMKALLVLRGGRKR